MRDGMMTKTEAAGTGTLETGEILPEEEEVLPEAGAAPEIPVHQEAAPGVPAAVTVLPEAAGLPGTGM